LRRMACCTPLFGILVIAFAGFLLCLLSVDAQAAQEVGEGRKIYDTIMRWINFGILVFFFLRYGKPALSNFLNGERNRVQQRLHEIEKDLSLAKMRVDEESKHLDVIEDSLEDVRRSIVELGEKEKERIIQSARGNAEQMIREAENELGFKMEEARRALNDRLAEQAVALAGEKLRGAFTEQDNEGQITGFIGRLDQVKSEEDLRMQAQD
jgi:F-type H+-transporting ATPase subunit b